MVLRASRFQMEELSSFVAVGKERSFPKSPAALSNIPRVRKSFFYGLDSYSASMCTARVPVGPREGPTHLYEKRRARTRQLLYRRIHTRHRLA